MASELENITVPTSRQQRLVTSLHWVVASLRQVGLSGVTWPTIASTYLSTQQADFSQVFWLALPASKSERWSWRPRLRAWVPRRPWTENQLVVFHENPERISQKYYRAIKRGMRKSGLARPWSLSRTKNMTAQSFAAAYYAYDKEKILRPPIGKQPTVNQQTIVSKTFSMYHSTKKLLFNSWLD